MGGVAVSTILVVEQAFERDGVIQIRFGKCERFKERTSGLKDNER